MSDHTSEAAPTVRQREVLSRVGETFTLAELRESACHRHAGHTRRMVAEMQARGAVEALGGERFRKTARAVPGCARTPAAPAAPRPTRSARRGQGSGPKPTRAARRSQRPSGAPEPVKFADFGHVVDGRDGQKVHLSPDRRTALLRSERAWCVLHRGGRLWRTVAGPLGFVAARREAVRVASEPPEGAPIGPLAPTPDGIELTDEGRGVMPTVDAILRRLLAVASAGERVDLSPLALAPFVVKLASVDGGDAERWWSRSASWTVENDRRRASALEVARAVAAHHSARFEPPTVERGGFDLEWLKYRLRAHGCARFHRLSGRYFAALCGPDGRELGVSIREQGAGWVWARHRDPDSPERGPFSRASALLDDLVAHLKLARIAEAPERSERGSSPGRTARSAAAKPARTPAKPARIAATPERSEPAPQMPLLAPVDVGRPPGGLTDARRLAWMIRRAADALGRPTRGVWLVVGQSVHPIGALPDGVDVELPTVFVDLNAAGEVEAVEPDPGFLLAIEPVTRALRRYRMQLDEAQRARLLTALRMARGEGLGGRSKQDHTGIKRRLTEGFKRERIISGREVWTDASRTMSWVAPKGATDAQVIEAFFAEMARRLAEELPEAVRGRAEAVLARAFRMARRRAPKSTKPRMRRGPTPKPAPRARPAAASPDEPDGPDALRGYDEQGHVEWASSVADFCASNAEDPTLCARVRALPPGETLKTGGGAAPSLDIRRRPTAGWPRAKSAERLGPPADGSHVPPDGSDDGFDIPWLRRELERHGCERLGAVTHGMYVAVCPRWGGRSVDLIVHRHGGGWYWATAGKTRGRGPFDRAGALFADVRDRLGLRPREETPAKSTPTPAAPSPTAPPAEALVGLPDYLALPKSRRPKYVVAVKDAAGLAVHLFQKAATRDRAHRVARGMLAVSPGMKLLVGKVDPKQAPEAFFEHIRALQKVDRLRLDLTEALADGVPPIGAAARCPAPAVAPDAPPRAKTADHSTPSVVAVRPPTSDHFELIPHHHTRHGYPIWVVKLRERRSDGDFEALKRLAREVAGRPDGDDRPSGYYSTYAKGGAIPGFIFTRADAAHAFVAAGDRLLDPPKPSKPPKPPKPPPAETPYAAATRVGKKGAAILEVLTEGMHGAAPDAVVWRRIGEPGAAVMPLSIDRLDSRRFAVAHNFIQNGDVVPDPDVELFRAGPGHWIPLAIQQPTGYRRYVEGDRVLDPPGQRDLARFVGATWMPNVRATLLDRGALPARRAEQLADGTERAPEPPPAPAKPADAPRVDPESVGIAEALTDLRGQTSGAGVFGYRPRDKHIIDLGAEGIGGETRLGRLLSKLLLDAPGPWWVVARRRAGAPRASERQNAARLVEAGALTGVAIERVILDADGHAYDLLAGPDPRDAAGGQRSGPPRQPWPDAPEKPAARTKANLRAVRVAHETQRAGAPPTPEQRRQMLAYTGWGGLSIAAVRDDWPDGIPQPDAEALVHEYYTPWRVCADITAAVRRLLGPGPAEILEPSAGVGRFIHAADAPSWRWTAIELSPLSALILGQTAAPEVEVIPSSFERWVDAHPDRRFDAVISNPPYGKRGAHLVDDKDRRFRVKAAYQYFMLRGLSLLKPGGVGAFLIPGGFMDGRSTASLRARVDREAALVAAFRLPSGLFPGARLALDVVFLRSRPAADTAPDDAFRRGRYFDAHPSHVLGEVKPTGRWGAPEVIGEYTGLPDFDAEPSQPAPMPAPMPSPAPAPSTEPEPEPEPELPPIADRQRRPKAAAHARALRFASPANRLMEVWHVQGRAIATDNRRLAEIPSDYAGPSQFVDRAGQEIPGAWGETPAQIARLLTQVHFTVDPALHGVFAGPRLRQIVGHRGYAVDPLLRLHAGQLYIESGDPATSQQRHIGRASGPDMVFGVKQGQLRAALTDVSGPVTVRLIGAPQPLTHGGRAVPWSMGPLVIDRADGERHVLSGADLRGHEASVVEIATRPITTGPAVGAAEAPEPHALAPGFTALEMDDGAPEKPRSPRPAVPKALRAVDMDRPTMPLADAIARAALYTRADDPILRGIRVGEGRVIASDGGALIEIPVDDTDAARVVTPDGAPLAVDYPPPSELIPAADPLATVDPAPLAALDARLRALSEPSVALTIDGPHLMLDGDPIPDAVVTPGSTSGTWRFGLDRLRPALFGARAGRLLLGPATAASIIERDDGQRIHLRGAVDLACEVCPLPTGPADAPPPAPPRGPSEPDLAALLARRLDAYQSADAPTQALLHPELAAALDAFAAVFGRRLATLDRPLLAQPPVRGDAAARRLLVEHPAGVPLARVSDPAALLAHGWRLDGERLLPRDDYLSGDLWARLARLDAIPEAFADTIPRQRAELDEAIGDVSYPEIADRVGLRDGWLPAHVIGAFLGHLQRTNSVIAVERRDGLLQLCPPTDGASRTYEGLLELQNASPVRQVIGYINHDERVFRPKVQKTLGEDLNRKRREAAERFEQRFKAFLSTAPSLRDRVVDAYRRAHRGFAPRTYSGAPLTLARWGSRVTPHPHQSAGARRAVDQRGMVAAYGVGVGKTFTACATVALARQKLGARRPVILVPNSLVSKWQRDIHAALPDFAVVTIGEKATQGRDGQWRYGPDTKAERALKWDRFRAGLYDIALVTPTAFMRTRITAEEFERLAAGATEIQRSVRLAQRNARGRANPSERQQAVLEQGVRAFLAEMLEPTWALDDVRWSQLGVDLLIVDEAQNYKGLHGPETREGSIPRFMGQTQPSKRAWNLDARAREVRSRDGFVVLLSATPAKNSPLELYNLWSYVNGELWRDHGIHDPEAFISRFLRIDPRLVVNATMEVEERPAVTAFEHLDELKAILLRWGEFIQPADIGLVVPEPTPEMIEVELDARQEARYARYVRQIEAELDKMRQGFKTNKVLGLLARMSLVSVHAELDRGLNYKSAGAAGIDPSSPKFEAIADHILGNNACGHIVFLQAIAGHRWLKDTLVKRGIPADRIGVLNAELAQSSDARQRIADRFNAGQLDVVIANSIAYEGLDLQVRTCAIHHADLPWEPATLNQRNGRAVRQGNTLGAVAIRYYFASRSMDGLRFNLIQGKQGWMGALLEGSDAIANPGADLELGPDEVLLLISRTPEKTRAQLDKLRAKAEAKRREDERDRALKLLELGAGQRLEARDAATPERSAQLRADAAVVFDALAKTDPAIWPWAALLAAARAADADEILARADTPPLFPGAWLRVDGRWREVGRFGWQGPARAVWLRVPGSAKWVAHTVDKVAAGAKPEDVAPARPADVADDWHASAARLIQLDVADAHRGWASTGWSHASPGWLAEAWPRVEALAAQAVTRIRANAWGDGYGPKEHRVPFDRGGAVYIHTRGGPVPPGAALLPPTPAGWDRWLRLATGDDFKLTLRAEASQWWWGRPLRRGMQRTRHNPTRRPASGWTAYRFAGAGSHHEPDGDAAMQLPPMTPIGSHLVLGVDHAERLVWLQAAKTVSAAKALQKTVPADVPLVAIVRVENNALGERRPMASLGGDPVFVRGEHLVEGAGLVLAADANDAVTAVLHARDLAGAYAANTARVPSRVPRTVIGTVRHRYRSAG